MNLIAVSLQWLLVKTPLRALLLFLVFVFWEGESEAEHEGESLNCEWTIISVCNRLLMLYLLVTFAFGTPCVHLPNNAHKHSRSNLAVVESSSKQLHRFEQVAHEHFQNRRSSELDKHEDAVVEDCDFCDQNLAILAKYSASIVFSSCDYDDASFVGQLVNHKPRIIPI